MLQELFVPQSQTFLKLVVAPSWRAKDGKDVLADCKSQYKNSEDKIFDTAY